MDYLRGLFTKKFEEKIVEPEKVVQESDSTIEELKNEFIPKSFLSNRPLSSVDAKKLVGSTDELNKEIEQRYDSIFSNIEKIEGFEKKISELKKISGKEKEINELKNSIQAYKEMNVKLSNVLDSENEMINRMNAVIIGNAFEQRIKSQSDLSKDQEVNIKSLPLSKINEKMDEMQLLKSSLEKEIRTRKVTAAVFSKVVKFLDLEAKNFNTTYMEGIELIDQIEDTNKRIDKERTFKIQQNIWVQMDDNVIKQKTMLENFKASIIQLERDLKEVNKQYQEYEKMLK